MFSFFQGGVYEKTKSRRKWIFWGTKWNSSLTLGAHTHRKSGFWYLHFSSFFPLQKRFCIPENALTENFEGESGLSLLSFQRRPLVDSSVDFLPPVERSTVDIGCRTPCTPTKSHFGLTVTRNRINEVWMRVAVAWVVRTYSGHTRGFALRRLNSSRSLVRSITWTACCLVHFVPADEKKNEHN